MFYCYAGITKQMYYCFHLYIVIIVIVIIVIIISSIVMMFFPI